MQAQYHTKAAFLLAVIAAIICGLTWNSPLSGHVAKSNYNSSRDVDLTPNTSTADLYNVKRSDEESCLPVYEYKGTLLHNMLTNPNLPAHLITRFTRYSQLARFGWKLQPDLVKNDQDEFFCMQPALQEYRLPGYADPSWRKMKWVNSEGPRVDGHDYEASLGYYANAYNAEHGVIMVCDALSPLQNEHEIPESEITPLRRWSDVTYLQWMNLATTQAKQKGLKYIMQVNILNDDTQKVIEEISNDRDHDDAPPWGQRLTLRPDEDAFKAILATPNGVGIAWLLAQHKETFGATRTVEQIVVFDAGHNYLFDYTVPCLVFVLNDPE